MVVVVKEEEGGGGGGIHLGNEGDKRKDTEDRIWRQRVPGLVTFSHETPGVILHPMVTSMIYGPFFNGSTRNLPFYCTWQLPDGFVHFCKASGTKKL